MESIVRLLKQCEAISRNRLMRIEENESANDLHRLKRENKFELLVEFFFQF